MESSELKTIIEKSGLSAYRIEKDLKIPNGTLNQVIKGSKKLPEKYEEPLRGLGGLIKPINEIELPAVSISDVPTVGKQQISYKQTTPESYDGARVTVEEVPEPEEVKGQSLLQPFLETVGNIIASEKAKKQVKRPDMSIADLL